MTSQKNVNELVIPSCIIFEIPNGIDFHIDNFPGIMEINNLINGYFIINKS